MYYLSFFSFYCNTKCPFRGSDLTTYHVRILQEESTLQKRKYFVDEEQEFDSVADLITFYKKNSLRLKNGSDIQLCYPLERQISQPSEYVDLGDLSSSHSTSAPKIPSKTYKGKTIRPPRPAKAYKDIDYRSPQPLPNISSTGSSTHSSLSVIKSKDFSSDSRFSHAYHTEINRNTTTSKYIRINNNIVKLLQGRFTSISIFNFTFIQAHSDI